MNKLSQGLLLATLIASQPVLACTKNGEEGFLPKNNFNIPVSKSLRTGITEAQFTSVIDTVEAIYAPIVSEYGGKLEVVRKWTDGTVNAYAEQVGDVWKVSMFGGLARHKTITADGFALVVCHELGHHIGGAPKVEGWFGPEWATNEGGSDYFATLKCLREFFAEDDNIALMENATIDAFAEQKCVEQFTEEVDQAICMRNSLAGASVAGLFMDLRKEQTRPKYDTPDTSEVTQTADEHPQTQCRFDTYWAGAICNVDKSVPVDQQDYKAGSCVAESHEIGLRPRCWFMPN